MKELETVLVEESIKQFKLLYDSIPHRIQAALAVKCNQTPYWNKFLRIQAEIIVKSNQTPYWNKLLRIKTDIIVKDNLTPYWKRFVLIQIEIIVIWKQFRQHWLLQWLPMVIIILTSLYPLLYW